MAAVVDGCPVHQDQVLVDAAAPDAESGRAFARGLDARHHLDDPDDIGFAHEGGQFLDNGGVHPFEAHLGDLQFVALALREDGRRFQRLPVRFQREIQLRCPRYRKRLTGGDIAGKGA